MYISAGDHRQLGTTAIAVTGRAMGTVNTAARTRLLSVFVLKKNIRTCITTVPNKDITFWPS